MHVFLALWLLGSQQPPANMTPRNCSLRYTPVSKEKPWFKRPAYCPRKPRLHEDFTGIGA